jgi:small-conductance mechanosensitive channel/CRP-like cAMP-binding protein
MIVFFALIVALLAAFEVWGLPEVHALVPKAYAETADQWIGIALIVAVTLLLDRLIRRFYWHGYLKRRLGRDTPALIQDIVTILLVTVGLSLGLTFVAGFSITGVVTASGATAIILGIALQAVIQDLFSGLEINFEGSYAIGDWLTIYTDQVHGEPIYGRVTHISWRSTNLMLDDGTLVMVPNHIVTANPVKNHSQPLEPKRLAVEICLDNRLPTERAVDMLLGEAFKAIRTPGLARVPEPTVIVTRMASDAIYYEVRFFHRPDQIDPHSARSVVLTALMDVLQQNELPTPVQQVEMTKPPEIEFAFDEEEERALLRRAPLFEGSLEHEHVELLVGNCHPAELPVGTVLMKQGDEGSSMFIIMEGAANVAIRGDAGQSHEVNILAAGDVVGEMSLLTGAARTATVTALTRVRVLEVTKSAIEMLLQKSPEVAERFSKVLAERQAQNAALAGRLLKREEVQRDLLARITTFFSRAFKST